MLNNNINILLVSLVHHIELQNFLNAPRNIEKEKVNKAAIRHISRSWELQEVLLSLQVAVV